jgi:preprotein translocase subunit SecG
MSILITFLLAIWMIVALLMILVILMQRPKSEGLGAAFGGTMTDNIFGAQTTNVLTKATGWFGGIFFALTFALSVLYAHRSTGESSLSRELKKLPPPPAAQTSPATQASPAASVAQPSPAPAASAAPNASAGPSVAGSAAPAPAPAESVTSSAAEASAPPEATPSKRKRRH